MVLSDPVYGLVYPFLLFSIIGLSLVMISYVMFYRDKNDDLHKIIFYLALSDWCRSVWWILTFTLGIDHEYVCIAQALGAQFFFVASWFWPLFFAVRLYMANILDIVEFRKFWAFHVVAWGFPLLVCLLGYTLDVYGQIGLWCWVTDNFYQIVLNEFPLGAMIIIQTYILIAILYQMIRYRRGYVTIDHSNSGTASSGRFMLLHGASLCWYACWGTHWTCTGR
eukprot:TRINITY_DN10404_c0_g1_i1.p1 TRINITY_DN10404_c0_g1~~TRINITY_DN10404_c0_g1_i1.p1  ORF type:complete len:223 (+),score=16.17 TRINITY_DN10404_c0_g1_i1:180-848(+)